MEVVMGGASLVAIAMLGRLCQCWWPATASEAVAGEAQGGAIEPEAYARRGPTGLGHVPAPGDGAVAVVGHMPCGLLAEVKHRRRPRRTAVLCMRQSQVWLYVFSGWRGGGRHSYAATAGSRRVDVPLNSSCRVAGQLRWWC